MIIAISVNSKCSMDRIQKNNSTVVLCIDSKPAVGVGSGEKPIARIVFFSLS